MAGKSNETHAARVSEAWARLYEAGRALRDEQKIALELPATNVPAGRTVFLGERIQVRYGERPLFAAGGAGRLPLPTLGPAGPGSHRGGEPGRFRARDAGGAG